MPFNNTISSPLAKSLLVSAHGIAAQNARLLAISQNLANASSRPTQPGELPYRRKVVSYTNRMDFKKGINLVHLKPVQFDKSPFKQVYDPAHPAADAKGYVQESNVNPLIEMADMREAGLTHEANLKVMERCLGALSDTIGLLKTV